MIGDQQLSAESVGGLNSILGQQTGQLGAAAVSLGFVPQRSARLELAAGWRGVAPGARLVRMG
jgi:hypothetical protein